MDKSNSFSNGPGGGASVANGASVGNGPSEPVRHGWFCWCHWCLAGHK